MTTGRERERERERDEFVRLFGLEREREKEREIDREVGEEKLRCVPSQTPGREGGKERSGRSGRIRRVRRWSRAF